MAGFTKALWCLSSVLPFISQPVSGLPARSLEYNDDLLDFNGTHPFAEFGITSPRKRAAGDYELRILSFGASIMSGTGSTTGDGYAISLTIRTAFRPCLLIRLL